MRKLTALLTLTIALLAALPAHADRRVSAQGRIKSVYGERDHYRVVLDRGDYSFRIPASLLGRRELRVGMNVRLEGVYRGGYVWVDNVDFITPSERWDDYVTGRIERINRYEQRLTLRDERGRVIDVELRGADERHRRNDINDLHRGDRVTLRGRWQGGTFYLYRIESIAPR